MKKVWLTLAVAGAAILGFGSASAIALAQGTGANSGSQSYASMRAMHSSPAMQQAMAKYSPQLQSRCNAMHAQMTSHMNGATGSGMMGGQMMGGQ